MKSFEFYEEFGFILLMPSVSLWCQLYPVFTCGYPVSFVSTVHGGDVSEQNIYMAFFSTLKFIVAFYKCIFYKSGSV